MRRIDATPIATDLRWRDESGVSLWHAESCVQEHKEFRHYVAAVILLCLQCRSASLRREPRELNELVSLMIFKESGILSCIDAAAPAWAESMFMMA